MHLLWIRTVQPAAWIPEYLFKSRAQSQLLGSGIQKKKKKLEPNGKFWETDALPCQEEKKNVKKSCERPRGSRSATGGSLGWESCGRDSHLWQKIWRRKSGKKNNNVASLLLRGYTRSSFSTRVTRNTPPTICASWRLSAGRPSSAERRWWAGVTVSRARSRHTVSGEPRK